MAPARQDTQFTDRVSKKSTQDTLDKLRILGGGKITEETGIAYHDGRQILLPRGMSYKQAAKLTQAQAISMEEVHNFSKVFKYRPWDGAYALQETLKEIFGLSGLGKAIHTMFGTQPPEYRNVAVGPGQEIKVPWGHIEFPPMEGTFITGVVMDPTYGPLFQVQLHAPKKYEPEIEGLWIALEDTLRRKSIYKGKAIVGVGKVTRDGYDDPSFLDPNAIDPAKVAYRQDVFDNLDSSVWGPIRTADLQRMAGNPLGLKTLLYGPYGTGKSLAGGLTARVAVENGWTFIQTKTGDEDLSKVLKTAELYAPAVVFIEDIDTLMDSDPDEMSKLLEMFDGVSSKGKEVMVLMTSNHVDSLSKGMMRVGRIDSAIEIGDLDRTGIERLIKATFAPEMLSDDINFDEICDSMEGFEPAFIMGTFKRTKSNAIIRTGSLNFKLSTSDFVLAAKGLRNQHDTHRNAKDRPEVESFGAAFESMIKKSTGETLVSHQIDMEDGEIMVRG